jgi:hypothetical protein
MLESTAARILAAIEDLSPDACGAFVIELDDQHVGSVLVERNQVCWAAAAGLRRRLLDLLRESLSSMLTHEELEALYRQCATEGRRVGEELVARSVMQGSVMRAAIKQHTIESLVALPERLGERITWVSHRAQGYHPRFTFSSAELYVGVNARLYATEAASAELALAVLEPETCAATFARDDDGNPIAVRAMGTHRSVLDLVELGLWADAAFGATPGFSPEVLRRAIATATGELTLAWRTSRFLISAAVVADRGVLDRLVGNLERRGYPVVLSRRAAGSRAASRDGLGVADGNP